MFLLAKTDPVGLEAIPTRLFEAAGKTHVHMRSSLGAKLPVFRHGEGTQNLAVLLLFLAFAQLRLSELLGYESFPLLTLEEPEAHLHPAAVRLLGPLLGSFTGQSVVSSHSGELISRIPVTSLRRLYKKNGKTMVGTVARDRLDDREMQDIDYHIRMNKGHYLFSRCWLLVEGQSDLHIMSQLFDYLGYSQDEHGISIIEISQAYKKGSAFIKIAKDLGIERFIAVDGDKAGESYIDGIRRYIPAGEAVCDRASCWKYGSIEKEFFIIVLIIS